MEIDAAAAWQAHIEIGRASAIADDPVLAGGHCKLRFFRQRLFEAPPGDAADEALVFCNRQLRAQWPRERPIQPDDGDKRHSPALSQFGGGKSENIEIPGETGRTGVLRHRGAPDGLRPTSAQSII